MKTVCITCFHGLIARNILQTKLLQLLRSAGIRIVLAVPTDKHAYFVKEFAHDVDEIVNVDFSAVPQRELIRLLSISAISVENLYVRRLYSQKQWSKILIAHISHVFGRFRWYHLFLRALDRLFRTSPAAKEMLEKIQPDMLFVTDLYADADKEFIKAAHKSQIYSVGMIRSWDNVSTKGILMATPDKILVHNSILIDELVAWNKVDPSIMSIIGIPHYDQYGQGSTLTREAFCHSMGLDPEKKIILYAPGGKILYQDDHLLLREFQQIFDTNDFADVQVLVRIPPSDEIEVSTIETDSRFVIDVVAKDTSFGRKKNEMLRIDEEHLINSFTHADVVLTLVSTVVIDAAAFDVPTIVLSFNPEAAKDDVKKFSRYSHFKKMLDGGNCKIVDSKAVFMEELQRYLRDKTADTEKRQMFIERYSAHFSERAATKRLFGALTSALDQL